MKLIKSLLTVMGLVILVGFVFVGYVSYERMTGTGYFGKPHGEAKPSAFAALETLAAAAGGDQVVAALGLPEDARVEAIHDSGAKVLLLIRSKSFGDRLYLIDPRTAVVSSAIALGSVVPTLPTPPVKAPEPEAKPAP